MHRNPKLERHAATCKFNSGADLPKEWMTVLEVRLISVQDRAPGSPTDLQFLTSHLKEMPIALNWHCEDRSFHFDSLLTP